MEGSIPNGTDFAWSFQLDGAAEDQRMLRHERCVIDGQDKGGGNQLPHSQLRQQTPALSRTLEATVLLQFDLDRLKRPSYFDEGTPQLQAGGYGLPSVLATMQGLVRERFEELERRFVAMVPTMQRILIGPGPVFRKETETIRIDDQAVTRLVDRRYTGHHLFFDTVSGQRIPAAQASDGSVILLGYLAVLLSDPPPHLVLIEEPEHGIHPQALGPLIQFFRDCLTANADLQILMTSHSPYLVDHLKPDEVVLTRRNEEGYTEAATLKDLPDVERWLENLSPGELWTMGGEDDLIQRIRQGGGDG
jgi:hypothetical protein